MVRHHSSGVAHTRLARRLLAGSATTALVLALATAASAQNSQLEPTFGEIAEGQGFGSVSQTIQAGGDIDAGTVAPECNGFIADAPDLVLDYTGSVALSISATSDFDTTLMVEAPDGMILCNDDRDGLNPGLDTASGEAGRYAIWVGSFDPITDNTYPDADVIIAELADMPPPVMPSQDFMASIAPTFGEIEVETGFGSQNFTLQAGGPIDAFAVNDMCAGFIAEAPDYHITLSERSGAPLDLSVRSQADTTLVVVGPDAAVYCNDDDIDLNPALSLFQPMAGTYAVWVGTFDPIQNDIYPDATLNVSMEGGTSNQPAAPDAPARGAFDTSGMPTFGRIELNDLTAGHAMTLQAGGSVDASMADSACNGFIAEVPDIVVDYPGGRTPMTIAATSQADTTLVVVAPDGAVYCNDDAIDLNPAVTINRTPAGAYAIFVGTFEPIENDFYPDATLTISDGRTGSGQSDRARMTPTFGRIDLTAGFGGHTIDLQAGGDRDASELAANCTGFIAEPPDYVIGYAGGEALRITATSDDDTTLAVMTPSGGMVCNDDFNGLNPGLVAEDAMAGDYAVWVGTFATIENETYPAATLEVTEISTTKTQPAGAVTSTSLTAGFAPDPFTTVLAAGGHIDASMVDGACYGSIAAQPDFVLEYTSGDWPLRVFVTSDADTTLLMRLPSGEVLCNDDFDGLNPSIALPNPQSGRYEVFIGMYDSSTAAVAHPEATLAITELLDQKDLPPGTVSETAIFSGLQRQDFELLAGGSFEAYDLLDASCGGYVAEAPDFLAVVNDTGIDVEMTVRSAEDTTLAIRTPSGAFICDDDSGGDFNPMVLLENADTGAYEVWLGTFGAVGMAPATFSVRDVNADSSTAPNVPSGGKK